MIQFISTLFFVSLFILLIWWIWFVAYNEKKLLKIIFWDVISLYKNFVHWNISKLFIWVFAWWLSILISIPFFVLFLIIWYYSGVGFSFLNSPYILLQSPFLVISFILYIASLLFWISYYRIPLLKLNLKYIEWENLGYLKNIYFDFSKIWKFFKVNLWMLFYISIPMLVFLFLFSLLFLLFWGWIFDKNWIVNNTFSIVSLILFIISSVSSLYIIYRVSFSYVLLSDDIDDHSAKYYVLHSVKLTKWLYTFVKVISIMFVFLLPLLPFIYFWESLTREREWIHNYVDYNKSLTSSWKLDDYDYQNLYLKYSSKSEKELNEILRTNRIYSYIYYVFFFLFLYWVIEMVYVSFYINVFLEKKYVSTLGKLSLIRRFFVWIFGKKDIKVDDVNKINEL